MKKTLTILIIFGACFAIAPFVEGAGASLYFSAQGNSFGAGETFLVDIKMNAGSLPINAARVFVNFPADKLKIIDASKDNSIFSLWPDEPAFSNENGEFHFSGGAPHPGFKGDNGQVLRIKFEAKKEGTAVLTFGKSQILADDGKGTDVFSRGFEETYEVKPPVPEILSSTHQDQNKWYKENNLEISWRLSPDATKVSFVLDDKPETWPDEIPEGRINSYVYKDIKDGIWYFHLRVNTDNGWSNPRHFRALIDATAPRPFDIVVDNGGDPTNPQPILYFEAEDPVSGVDRYVVKIGEGSDIFIETLPHNPFKMPLQKPGVQPVLVEAFDKAENSRESATIIDIKPIQKPLITVWPRKFISGGESFYIAGTALPNVEVIISLGKNSEIIKEWRAHSDEKGEWSFSSNDILRSGFYRLSVMAQDERGAVSQLSEEKNIEVDFSGIESGPIMITFGSLVAFLLAILSLGMVFIGFNVYQSGQLKKSLKKEIREAEESLYRAFLELRKEVERKIEMLDSHPGFDKQERIVCDDLLKAIQTAQESIDREILDISNCLS